MLPAAAAFRPGDASFFSLPHASPLAVPADLSCSPPPRTSSPAPLPWTNGTACSSPRAWATSTSGGTIPTRPATRSTSSRAGSSATRCRSTCRPPCNSPPPWVAACSWRAGSSSPPAASDGLAAWTLAASLGTLLVTWMSATKALTDPPAAGLLALTLLLADPPASAAAPPDRKPLCAGPRWPEPPPSASVRRTSPWSCWVLVLASLSTSLPPGRQLGRARARSLGGSRRVPRWLPALAAADNAPPERGPPESSGDWLAYPRTSSSLQWRWRLDQPKAFIGADTHGESFLRYRLDHHLLGLAHPWLRLRPGLRLGLAGPRGPDGGLDVVTRCSVAVPSWPTFPRPTGFSGRFIFPGPYSTWPSCSAACPATNVTTCRFFPCCCSPPCSAGATFFPARFGPPLLARRPDSRRFSARCPSSPKTTANPPHPSGCSVTCKPSTPPPNVRTFASSSATVSATRSGTRRISTSPNPTALPRSGSPARFPAVIYTDDPDLVASQPGRWLSVVASFESVHRSSTASTFEVTIFCTASRSDNRSDTLPAAPLALLYQIPPPSATTRIRLCNPTLFHLLPSAFLLDAARSCFLVSRTHRQHVAGPCQGGRPAASVDCQTGPAAVTIPKMATLSSPPRVRRRARPPSI